MERSEESSSMMTITCNNTHNPPTHPTAHNSSAAPPNAAADSAVVEALEALATRGGRGGEWALSERVPAAMYGSGEQHEAWVFRREPRQ